MKKPVVDYRQFKLSKINEPQFSHLKLLGWWLLYLIMYAVAGALVPSEKCFMVHSRLDDLIPFCEYFIVPYVLWYFLIAISLGYFALYNIESFKKLQKYMIMVQFISVAIFLVFPTTQLRADLGEIDNVFKWIVNCIYTVDNNTNACPSLHVSISVAIASVWAKEKSVNIWWRILVVAFAVLICLSTMFIKQHSIIDVFGGLLVSLIPEYFLFWRKCDKK